MKVGVILPLFSGDRALVLDSARRAEDLGYDGVFAFDHFFPPGAPADRPSLEPFAMLAAVAAVTDRVTVGTLVTRASLRSAGLVAKLAAALDDVCGSRSILAIGTGDAISKPEHDTFGLPYLGRVERRPHLAETVCAVRALLSGSAWPGGEWVPPASGPILPPPRPPSGPPLWIGGVGDAVVRLAAAEADAWNGWGTSLVAFERKAGLLGRSAEDLGRAVEATWGGIVVVGRDDAETRAMMRHREASDALETNVWAGAATDLVRWLEALETAGAAWSVLAPAGPRDRLELIGTEVLPRLGGRA